MRPVKTHMVHRYFSYLAICGMGTHGNETVKKTREGVTAWEGVNCRMCLKSKKKIWRVKK